MAKGQSLTIPPGLEKAQKKIIKYSRIRNQTSRVASALVTSRRLRLDKKPTDLVRDAKNCALWLAEKHLQNAGKEEVKSFLLKTEKEILGGIFLPEYFDEIQKKEDMAELTFPNCVPFNGNPNHNNGTPQVIMETCTYGKPTLRYPLPQNNSGLPNPSPGWAGQSVDGTWANEYHVQQLTSFNQVPQSSIFLGQYTFFKLDYKVTVNASTEGIKTWPSVCMRFTTGTPYPIGHQNQSKMLKYSMQYLRQRVTPPPPQSPFLWIEEGYKVASLSSIIGPERSIFPIERHLWAALSPPQGRYFGRNTSVIIRCEFNLKYFVSV